MAHGVRLQPYRFISARKLRKHLNFSRNRNVLGEEINKKTSAAKKTSKRNYNQYTNRRKSEMQKMMMYVIHVK